MIDLFSPERTAPCSPGEAIRAQVLAAKGMSLCGLARALGIPKARLSMVMHGIRPVSPEIALRLDHVTGIPAAHWLLVRAEYELHQERRRLAEQLDRLTRVPEQRSEAA